MAVYYCVIWYKNVYTVLTTDKTVSLIYHIEPESSNNKEKETKNKQVRSLFSTKLSDEQEKSTQKKTFLCILFFKHNFN